MSNEDKTPEETETVEPELANDAVEGQPQEPEQDQVETETVTETATEVEPEVEVGKEPASEQEEETEPLQIQLLRLSADFDNFRKRTRREKEVWSRDAQERIVTDLLTALDSFELGLSNAEEHEAKPEVLDGFRMVHAQWLSVFKRYGVEPIEVENRSFDPERHEAVSFLNSEDQAENEIIAETRKGFVMGDKLIRAAQVVVSRGPAASESEES